MSVAADIKPETPTGMIGSHDEYRRALQRVEELAGARKESPEGLELAALTAAVLGYETRLGGGAKDAVAGARAAAGAKPGDVR